MSTFNVGIQVMPSVGASVVWSVQTTLDDPFTTLIPKAVPAPDNLKTGTDYAIGNIVTPDSKLSVVEKESFLSLHPLRYLRMGHRYRS